MNLFLFFKRLNKKLAGNMLSKKYRICIISILTLFFLINAWEKASILSINKEQELNDTLYIFTDRLNEGAVCLNAGYSENMIKFKATWMKRFVGEITQSSYRLKKYIQNNTLHFNIPPICYKYPISQHTADG